MLLILATPTDTTEPLLMASLWEALGPLTGLTDQALHDAADDNMADDDADLPRCPHCGSCRTRFLEEYPRCGVP